MNYEFFSYSDWSAFSYSDWATYDYIPSDRIKSLIPYGDQYSHVAATISNMFDSLVLSAFYLNDALSSLVNISKIEPKRDLFPILSDITERQSKALQSPYLFSPLARSLNKNILDFAKDANGRAYGNINDWFFDQSAMGYTVSLRRSWADLCLFAGYVISDSYIF